MTQEQTDKIYDRMTCNECREMNKIRFHQAVNEAFNERIKQFNITDIDQPIFTHTKAFEENFCYIKGKLIEYFTEQPF